MTTVTIQYRSRVDLLCQRLYADLVRDVEANAYTKGVRSLAEYGRSLRSARRRQGYTQQELADLIGVTKSYVSKIEKGAVIPSRRFHERVQAELWEAQPQTSYLLSPPGPEIVRESGVSPYQLKLDLHDHDDWVRNMLPLQTEVDPGPPPVLHWDIPQTITELSYLTHNFFRYYGKFPPTIPRRLLRDFRPPEGTWVLDNFSGSGTTLVEAACEGHPSLGVDISPLATLAARVKTFHVDLLRLQRVYELLVAALSRGPALPDAEHLPPDHELDKWFSPDAVRRLAQLKTVVLGLEAGPERDFLSLAFFSIIRRVSHAYDGEVRPHVNTTKRSRDVFAAFKKKYSDMATRMAAFQRESSPDTPALALSGDNRELKGLLDWDEYPIGLVVSHPPYLNCFDYFPVYKLEYLWAGGFDEPGLDVEYTELRKKETRCWPATNQRIFDGYFRDLERAYGQVADLVDRGTRCCVVLGDCSIKGEVVPVLDRFSNIMDGVGFSLERVLLRSTHYGIGKYAYSHRADYHGKAARKRDGILIFKRR